MVNDITTGGSEAGTWAPVAMAYVETEQGATGAIVEVRAAKPTRYSTTGPQKCPHCAHCYAATGCGDCDHTSIAQCTCGEVSTLTDGVTDEAERVWRCNACDAKWLAEEEAEASGPSVAKCGDPAVAESAVAS